MKAIDAILTEYADKPASLFVFPTDVAASRWADRLLRLRQGGTLAMDKFIAWDTFKQNSISSKVQDKKCIPSVVRKMFVIALIRENAGQCANGGQPLLTSLIRSEWAAEADSYVNWLTDILPQLGAWFSQTTGMHIGSLSHDAEGEGPAGAGSLSAESLHLKNFKMDKLDGDDRDLFFLALRYRKFLDENGLFEPAWEKAPFLDNGKECFIFFPDSLSDFREYRELLESSAHVKIITVGPGEEEKKNREVFFYTNSRSEITEAALYIESLHYDRGIPWEYISVSLPDSEYYGPYVCREFETRNIPYERHAGIPLASYPAGKFFSAIALCASSDYSFASLTALLLNPHLPWKHDDEIKDLIRFGIDNNCICSWKEEAKGKTTGVNVWEDALSHPYNFVENETRKFFFELMRQIKRLRNASSFFDARRQYFVFRESFFDMDKCLGETDTILSRCISELSFLADIEKEFPNLRVSDPYAFFVSYLEEKSYLAQNKSAGVAIFPYRTSAPAPFSCHIILGASQKALTAVYTPLPFLSRSRREKIGLSDEDASKTFMALHQYNSQLPAAFFCSEQTFSGYAIPHSALDAPLEPRVRYGGDPGQGGKFTPDLFRTEAGFYSSLHFPPQGAGGEIMAAPGCLYEIQKNGFERWMARRRNIVPVPNAIGAAPAVLSAIKEKFSGRDELAGKMSVSASSLAPYYECPLKWFFDRVLEIEGVEIEASLLASNISGTVFHSVLNLFFEELRKNEAAIEKPEPLSGGEDVEYGLAKSYSALLKESVDKVFDSFPNLPQKEYQAMSMLGARLLRSQKDLYFSHLEKCLIAFTSFFSDHRVIATETSFTLPGETCFYRGTVDIVLEDPGVALDASGKEEKAPDGENKKLVIVDFKTYGTPSIDECAGEEGLANFQLPMYLRLVEAGLKREVHTALFFSIIKAVPMVLFGSIKNAISGETVPGKNNTIDRGSDAFLRIMDEFKEKAERFACEISAGSFSACPADYSDKCRSCPNISICRTFYAVYRERRGGS